MYFIDNLFQSASERRLQTRIRTITTFINHCILGLLTSSRLGLCDAGAGNKLQTLNKFFTTAAENSLHPIQPCFSLSCKYTHLVIEQLETVKHIL
jgi:hypothetical protein